MSKAEMGAGDVLITLGDQEVILKPTLKAATVLSNGQGGITRMVQRCLDFEFDAIHTVILAGLGMKGSKDLFELIYQAGLINLAPHCIQFLHVVANGGRPTGDAEEEEEDEKAPLESGSQ